MILAKNDKILVDGMIDEICENSNYNSGDNQKRGKVFEKFSISELLKNYDVNENVIDNGIVDGANDGGIDGFYIFLNSRPIRATEDILILDGAIIDVYIIQCKHEDSFKLAPLNTLFSTLSELFDFSLSKENFCSDYNERVVQKRELLKTLYKKLAARNPIINIKICYITRGDVKELGENISAKAVHIESMVTNSFSGIKCNFLFIGSEELIEMHRKKRNGEVSLRVKKSFRYGKHYVVVVSLLDYYRFLTTENEQLKRYYFDENVRDYLGSTRTNNDIFETLVTDNRPDFWLMNNGITIVSDNAHEIDEEIVINNVQIVNGLQTSNTIYNYFSSMKEVPNDDQRSILIKVIMKQDDDMKNLIIQSTNNQSQIGLSSLMAVDKVQKDIEQYLLEKGYYYERRLNEHKNAGVEASEILTPLELAAIHVALVLKLPFKATQLKQKHFKSEANYDNIFNSKNSLKLWAQYAMIVKTIKRYFEDKYTHKKGRRQKIFIPLAAFFLVSIKYKDYSFTTSDIINIQAIDNKELINEIFEELDKIMKGRTIPNINIKILCETFADRYEIKNKQVILFKKNNLIDTNLKRNKNR